MIVSWVISNRATPPNEIPNCSTCPLCCLLCLNYRPVLSIFVSCAWQVKTFLLWNSSFFSEGIQTSCSMTDLIFSLFFVLNLKTCIVSQHWACFIHDCLLFNFVILNRNITVTLHKKHEIKSILNSYWKRKYIFWGPTCFKMFCALLISQFN